MEFTNTEKEILSNITDTLTALVKIKDICIEAKGNYVEESTLDEILEVINNTIKVQ